MTKIPKNQPEIISWGSPARSTNRPGKAIEVYQQLDPATFPMKYESQTWWHSVYAANLIRLDRLNEAMNILRVVPIEKAANSIFLPKTRDLCPAQPAGQH